MGQEPGSPGLPFPGATGAGAPLAVPGCAKGDPPPPQNPVGADKARLGNGCGSAFRGRER